MPIYHLGELFSGPGGLAYGAMTAAIKNPNYRIVHAWANDYDASTCDTYRHNICHNDADDTVICGDVRNLDIASLLPIDAFAFGFPCNDFSTVGEQKGFAGTYGPYIWCKSPEYISSAMVFGRKCKRPIQRE